MKKDIISYLLESQWHQSIGITYHDGYYYYLVFNEQIKKYETIKLEAKALSLEIVNKMVKEGYLSILLDEYKTKDFWDKYLLENPFAFSYMQKEFQTLDNIKYVLDSNYESAINFVKDSLLKESLDIFFENKTDDSRFHAIHSSLYDKLTPKQFVKVLLSKYDSEYHKIDKTFFTLEILTILLKTKRKPADRHKLFKRFSKDIWNKNNALKAVIDSPRFYTYLPKKIKNDINFINELISLDKKNTVIGLIDPDLISKEDTIKALERCPTDLPYLNVKNIDSNTIFKAIGENYYLFMELSEEMMNEKLFCLSLESYAKFFYSKEDRKEFDIIEKKYLDYVLALDKYVKTKHINKCVLMLQGTSYQKYFEGHELFTSDLAMIIDLI